jgi:hypothetical protein
VRIFGDGHDCILFETKFRTDDEIVVDCRIWIGPSGPGGILDLRYPVDLIIG